MPPHSDHVAVSTLKISAPSKRSLFQTGTLWLKAKHNIDGAEGLWRIHDNLYDVSNFIKHHPGGSEWLELTKGTDITEAFEVHHLSTHPQELLKKYFVRKASTKRISPFTFNDQGFYKTLKREVVKELGSLPKRSVKTTAFFTDVLLIGTFFFSVLATLYWNYWLAVLSGIFLALLTIASHNYTHQKDNWRMLYFNLSLIQAREWRISHILSHHLHTNTINDLEMSMFEPALQFLPHQKHPIFKYGYYFYFPLAWMTAFHALLFKRLFYVAKGDLSLIQWYDFVPFTLPSVMYLFGNQSFADTFWMWTIILLVGSFHFAAVGFTAAHHHPDIFHDGDTPRSDSDYDWGLSQLDSIMDRHDINWSHFLVLTNFGDHALHHLFPTLDHGTLDMLYPVLKKVCKEFNVDLRVVSQMELIKGSFRQVAKTVPNPNPPNLLKTY